MTDKCFVQLSVIIDCNELCCYSDAVDDGETRGKKHSDPMDLIVDIRLRGCRN